jgi:hypothetical protein
MDHFLRPGISWVIPICAQNTRPNRVWGAPYQLGIAVPFKAVGNSQISEVRKYVDKWPEARDFKM